MIFLPTIYSICLIVVSSGLDFYIIMYELIQQMFASLNTASTVWMIPFGLSGAVRWVTDIKVINFKAKHFGI